MTQGDPNDRSPSSPPRRRRPPAPTAGVFDQLAGERSQRALLRDALRANEERDHAFRRMILSLPPGTVSTYGGIAAAAGYPRYHRAVARLLRSGPADHLPWHRVVGAGGEIKLRGEAAREQRARLLLEGVEFLGKRVSMDRCEHPLRPEESTPASSRASAALPATYREEW